MRYRDGRRFILAAMLTILGGVTTIAADKPAVDQAAVNKAFEALKTYDWGKDYSALKPIDEAVVATHGDAAARKDLETRLAAVLKTCVSRDAKDYVCRKLTVIGSAAVGAHAGRPAGRQRPFPHGPLRLGTHARAGSGPGLA